MDPIATKAKVLDSNGQIPNKHVHAIYDTELQ
jgi:hypothetical protein